MVRLDSGGGMLFVECKPAPSVRSELLSSFSAAAEDWGEGQLALRVCGELDMAVVDRLDSALAEAGTEWRLVVVNLNECGFID